MANRNTFTQTEGYLVILNPGNSRKFDDTLVLEGAAVNFSLAITAYQRTEAKGPTASISFATSEKGTTVFGRINDAQTFLMDKDPYQTLALTDTLTVSIPVLWDGNIVTGYLLLEMLEDGLKITWIFPHQGV